MSAAKGPARAPQGRAPQPYYTDELCTMALWHNVVVVDTIGEIDAPRMSRIFDAYAQLLARPLPHVVGLCIMRPGAPVSSSEARAEATRRTKELGTALAHVALVTEDATMGGQLLRAAVRGYNMLTRNTRVSLYGSVADAMQMLVPLVIANVPATQMADELDRAVAAVRESFRPDDRRSGAVPKR